MIREDFESKVGLKFDFSVLSSEDRSVCEAIVMFGVELFDAVAELCEEA
jgi:hypothetical protein